MKIEKKVLTQLPYCYAAGSIKINDIPYIFFATEGNGPAYLYNKDTLEQIKIWDNPGGTMSVAQVPDKNGDFLAVQNFFPGFKSANACIVWAHPLSDGTWSVKNILNLPYVHRFDLLTGQDGTHYFIGCTLCTSKKNIDDWSDPGKIYVAQLPEDLNEPMKLTVIKDNLYKNHGYSRVIWHDKMVAMVTCESGVFAITPPENRGGNWQIEMIDELPTSDVAGVDLDNDGKIELATIEPFHGNNFVIYHQDDRNSSKWNEVYRYPEAMNFAHVVWAGKVRGIPTIIGGQRDKAQDLFYIQYVNGQYVKTTIDSGVGPSNVAVINEPDRDIIIAANREIGEAVLYIVTD